MEDRLDTGMLTHLALLLQASDEEVVLHVKEFAVLRAVFEAEGYYDESAGGEPDEEDLYRIEVLDAGAASAAAEALEVEGGLRLQSLGLSEAAVRRLFPAGRWSAERDATRIVQEYLLAVAWALYGAAGPAARQRVLDASVHWSPAIIRDRWEGLPRHWQEALSQAGEPTRADAPPEDV